MAMRYRIVRINTETVAQNAANSTLSFPWIVFGFQPSDLSLSLWKLPMRKSTRLETCSGSNCALIDEPGRVLWNEIDFSLNLLLNTQHNFNRNWWFILTPDSSAHLTVSSSTSNWTPWDNRSTRKSPIRGKILLYTSSFYRENQNHRIIEDLVSCLSHHYFFHLDAGAHIMHELRSDYLQWRKPTGYESQ